MIHISLYSSLTVRSSEMTLISKMKDLDAALRSHGLRFAVAPTGFTIFAVIASENANFVN